MQKVRILVVEDEIILSEDIVFRLEEMDYEIVGTAPSVPEALRVLDEHTKQIDLILIDIILKGELDGIELARIINERYQIPFIFLTSQADPYFVERAKSVQPYAYMLKPFNDLAIRISIELALSNYAKNMPIQEISEPPNFTKKENPALSIKNSLFLKKDNFFKRVSFKDILWLTAESNYTILHTTTGEFMYATLLHKIEDKLPNNQFIRVHRSYIVNMHNVTGFIKNVLYVEEKAIPVSKRYADAVFMWFNTL